MKKLFLSVFGCILLLSVGFTASCEKLSQLSEDLASESTSIEESDFGSEEIGETAPGGETPIETEPKTESPFIYSETDTEAVITGLKTATPELVIPAEINGKSVVGISERAFASQTGIINLTISDGVKTIGKEAFKNCSALKSVYIPESVEFIGYSAFNGCSALESITLPFTGEREKLKEETYSYPFGYIFGKERFSGATETSQYYYYNSLNEVASSAYYIPKTLKEVKVTGKGNTHLPYDAFRSLENLKKITIGEKVESIGKFAFSVCHAEIEFENPKIACLGEYSFADYKGSAVTIPESVKKIGKCAFEDCENLKGIVVPETVKEIDLFAFRGCTRMNKVVIEEGVEKIGVNAFYFCTSLKTVSLPNSLKEISDSAFMSCRAITSIDIPKSVKIIGKDAFKNCNALSKINFKEKNGWRYYNSTTSGDYITEQTASNSSTIAYYLTGRLSDYIWERVDSAPIQKTI